ncbi:MAG: hypothetical protein EA398_02915 [Deltaproteobacteria bacterium]|nr:MAG: hypothetical protein EA398_02915 [Deltaproteobacteria bacterium]
MRFHRRIRLDRIGSVTLPARLNSQVEVSPEVSPDEGTLIAVRALAENPNYGHLELPSGRLARVVTGNLLAGALGARQALHGYMGRVPDTIAVGDRLALLNMGGVIGVCDQPSTTLGPPIPVEVLGQISRDGVALSLRQFALPSCPELDPAGPPLVLILGTCMNSGKTFAAAEIVRILSHNGVRIAAGKLSGVAAQRDLLHMADNGAVATASFLDCGLPSTVNAPDLGAVARSVIQHLEKSRPELILLELGDGIIGGYNTGSILEEPSVLARTGARVLCANDLVGTWGSVQFLDRLGHRPDIISGPVTDNAVGTSYIDADLGITAANARLHPRTLAEHVARAAAIAVEWKP